MELESKINPAQKDSTTCSVLYEVAERTDFIKAESRIMVTRC
jgi:hypothetical protein